MGLAGRGVLFHTRGMRTLLLALSLFAVHASAAPEEWADDNQVRDAMIKESIHSFVSSSCPCPFHYRPNGELCGTKSTYDQTNGKMPLCYRTDITVEMVEEHRVKLRRKASAVIR